MITSKPIYMGIDYSMTSPAVCVWDGFSEFSFGNCRLYALTPSRKFTGKFLHNINITLNDYNKDDNNLRFDLISNWVDEIRIKYKVSEVFLEGYAMGASGRVFHIGENTGILKHKLFNAGVKISVIPPTVVKKFATGKGNANKEKMNEVFSVENSLNLKKILNQTDKQWNPSCDIIDAFYILKTGLLQNEII